MLVQQNTWGYANSLIYHLSNRLADTGSLSEIVQHDCPNTEWDNSRLQGGADDSLRSMTLDCIQGLFIYNLNES